MSQCYVIKQMVDDIACTIELLMHLGALLSIREARVELGYGLVPLLRFFRAWQPPACIHNSIDRGYYTVAQRYEFYFRVAKQYFTNERSEWVKYCFCHEKIKFISSSRRVMFFLLYRQADDVVFDDFPKISDHLPTISEDFQNCSEGQTNVSEHFPKMSEDLRWLPKTFEEDPKMFRWYTNEFKYNLRTFALIVSAQPYCARKFTCHVMHERAR